MRRYLLGVMAVLAWAMAGSASANAQVIDSRPIDTTKMVVQPADTATNIFSGTARYVSRAVAGIIDDNAFVRTINNVLGRRDRRATTQPNGLPLPGMYESTRYPNSFKPAMPTTMQYGQSVPVKK
jgi:hypothetical protein